MCRSVKLVLSSALPKRLILFGYVLLNMYLKKEICSYVVGGVDGGGFVYLS